MESTPHFPIYMDYGATTPCDPRVVDVMIPWLREHFGNPASRSHAWGWEAEAAVENAREQVAELIGADPREIVWTSGATESNNLALKGAAHFYQSKGRHLITVKTEHKAVLDTMRELERQGFEVSYLDVQEDGLLSFDVLKAAIRPDTILVSVMFVNNEIGVIQDIAAIGALCREKGILLHVDAAQATGKVEIDLKTAPRVSARCMFGASRVCGWRHRCMGAAMSAACARAPCRHTSAWAWARLSVWHALKWLRTMPRHGRCMTA